MFPLTHVHFAQMVFPEVNDLIVLGSIFPDTTVGNSLTYNQTHRQGERLYQYVKRKDPDFLPFVEGILTHGVEPGGLDYFGDEKYLDFEKGYCFEKARPIIDSTISVCNLPRRFGWWKAHNFIEMAIELDIDHFYPDAHAALCQAYENTEIIAWAGEVLADFYYATPHEIIAGIIHFRNYVLEEEVCAANLAVSYNNQMFKKHSIKIDIKKVEDLILRSKNLIEKDYKDFLLYCHREVRKMLDKTINKW